MNPLRLRKSVTFEQLFGPDFKLCHGAAAFTYADRLNSFDLSGDACRLTARLLVKGRPLRGRVQMVAAAFGLGRVETAWL